MSNLADRLKILLSTVAIPNDQLEGFLKEVEIAETAKTELEEFENWHNNIILASDAYKTSHFELYPEKTEFIYSYIESRGSDRGWKRAVFAGLQAFRKKYLRKPLTMKQKEYAKKVILDMGLPFHEEGWDYIINELKGKLPIKIRAVKEGTVINNKNVLVTVVNTDPKCFWLTNYIETALLRAIWYMTTVATLSFHCKLALIEAYKKSSDVDIRPLISDLSFKLHDFGARGVSSSESAQLGGMGHLLNFIGSDTLEAVEAAIRFYGASKPAVSIPAAEHSTVTSWGRTREAQAYAQMLAKFAKPGSVVAVVSDSYDLYNAVSEIWGKELKQAVIDSGATIVVRPDSGDPLTVPVEVIKLLAETYGYTVNSKGYKVLPSYIRVIQGDGITETTLPIIINNLLDAGFSIDNLAFGMGGGLLQLVNRDTLKFAMKCSAISINGVWYDVCKEPKTDPGKRSKKGRFKLIKLMETDGENITVETYYTIPVQGHEDQHNYLEIVYEDGNHAPDQLFDDMKLTTHNAALELTGLL